MERTSFVCRYFCLAFTEGRNGTLFVPIFAARPFDAYQGRGWKDAQGNVGKHGALQLNHPTENRVQTVSVDGIGAEAT